MRKCFFTLLEVVIALAVLTMGLVSILALTSAASNRVGKAASKWNDAHRLAQASEFFLLAGPRGRLDSEIFPYDDSRAECLVETPENLPAEVPELLGKWKLVKLKISLFDSSGERDSVSVEKILSEEELK